MAGELASCTAEDLLLGDAFGEKSLVVVGQALGRLGLTLRGESSRTRSRSIVMAKVIVRLLERGPVLG